MGDSIDVTQEVVEYLWVEVRAPGGKSLVRNGRERKVK